MTNVALKRQGLTGGKGDLHYMADQSQLDILQQGVQAWSSWREQYSDTRPNLSGADLAGADLTFVDLVGADLSGARLQRANLSEARLDRADLSAAELQYAELSFCKLRHADLRDAALMRANLQSADLTCADLRGAKINDARAPYANFREAELQKAYLWGSDFREADFKHAHLNEANLMNAQLVGADFRDAILTGAKVFGISAWKLELSKGTEQDDLVITDPNYESQITVDDIEVAQFVYLLLNNEKIRQVIDTIGEKGVLILGRFTEERKAVLDALRDQLRELGFVPMMFDFERPTQRDFTETIKTLAGLSRFIIADITNPRSSPLELQATMPDYMIPFVPIIHEDEEPFAMFRDLQHKYGDWVLDVLKYDSAANLQKRLEKAVVRPALDKSDQLIYKKAEAIRTRHINEYQ